MGPGDAVVGGAVDGEGDGWGFGGVVLPGGEEGVVGKFERAGVEGARDGVVRRGLEDGVVVVVGDCRGGSRA